MATRKKLAIELAIHRCDLTLGDPAQRVSRSLPSIIRHRLGMNGHPEHFRALQL